MIENRLLNGPGSEKETRHIVFSLAGSQLTYTPGDSIGLFATTRGDDVDEILERLGADGSEPILLPSGGETVGVRDALYTRLTLAQPTRKAIEVFAAKATDTAERAKLEQLLAPESKEALSAFLKDREFVDLLEEFPSVALAPQEFVSLLRKLNPRLYSIASSPRVHGDDIHITVAAVRYETNGRMRGGVCSTFLSDRVRLGESLVPSFIVHSHFGLPESGDADLIMIGPGTGIAPFRSFLHDRRATGATGRNWLFFGGQRQATDYLYGDEFTAMHADGLLTRVDLAFSRDQEHKIYVQDRMREAGAELWSWLEKGAHFYVCGDAKRMAKDVDAELHALIQMHGGLDADAAVAYVKQMKKDRRYLRDVY